MMKKFKSFKKGNTMKNNDAEALLLNNASLEDLIKMKYAFYYMIIQSNWLKQLFRDRL